MGVEQAGNLPTVHEGQRLMDEVVALVVERLEARANRMSDLGSPRGELLTEAVCTIRALVAANSVLAAAHNDALAKLREAVEVMHAMREETAALLERYDDHEQSNHPHVYVLLKRVDAFLATMEKHHDGE